MKAPQSPFAGMTAAKNLAANPFQKKKTREQEIYAMAKKMGLKVPGQQ